MLCQDGDIIIDLDTDDYLIGNQVFQLVNTFYQKGQYYNGKHEDIWSLFLNYVGIRYPFIPYTSIYGGVDQKVIEKQTFREIDVFRTTHLRTYLHKLYSKIDPKDFIDVTNIK